jgi:hypothetical protein
MKVLIDFFTFKTMVSPTVLQVLFWAGIGGCIYGSYVLVKLDNWAWWMPLIFGTLVTRVIFERAILAFRSYLRLSEIADIMIHKDEQ